MTVSSQVPSRRRYVRNRCALLLNPRVQYWPKRLSSLWWNVRYMNRDLALKIVLALVGILFGVLAYPLAIFMRRDPATSMMFSLYVTLGVFLLLAIRNPSASRSLIAFTAWSSFAHAAIMGTQACRNMVARGELIGVAVLVAIGVALIALAPAKQSPRPAS